MAELSRLLKIISLFYVWQPEEIDDLRDQLLEQRIAAWRQAIETEASKLGCNRSAYDPKGGRRQKLRRDSIRDAKSIAKTWQRDVERQLLRLYNNNPRGNRNYYIKNMESWARARGQWKNLQIGSNTEMSAQNYAREMFYERNKKLLKSARFYYAGPAITTRSSKPCKRRNAAGLVTLSYTKRERPPTHPNCFHWWELATAQRSGFGICDKLWLGGR